MAQEETKVKDKRMAIEKYVCPHCGIKFRYLVNAREHVKKCIYFTSTPYKYSDEIKLKSVTLK